MIRSLPFLFSAVVFALLVSACTPDMEGQVEIHYMGIGFETYLPITPENIDETHTRYGAVEGSDPRFQEVMRLIDGAGSGSFYKSTTRARIRDTSGTTIYLDNYGGIQRSFREVSLNETNLNRVADLLFSMTALRQAATGQGWAVEAAHAYIAETEGWPQSEYNLLIDTPSIGYKAGLVIVRANHHDDGNVYNSETGVLTAGGGKSFELHFDPLTRDLLRTVGYQ